jgi:hypothetical protein
MPDAAARDVVWLATAPRAEVPYSEFVQHRKILAWDDYRSCSAASFSAAPK